MGAEIPDGAVLVARAILNSSLWTMRAEDRLVAITCICLANWRPRSWFNGKERMVIKRGEFVRSWQHLAEECKFSVKTVRTSVKNLELVGFLARKRAGHVQLFCIPKYDHYQDLTKYSDSAIIKTGKESGSNRADDGQDTGSEWADNGQQTGNKQELNKGIIEEGKKGTHRESVHNGTVESHVISAWNRGPGFPIDHPKGQKLVRAYIDSGVTAERQLEAVSNQPACKGKKLWEVIEPLRPAQDNGVPSMDKILDNLAKEMRGK
jgi:hypothetical protein